jgi:hypothetical protein
LQEAHYIDNIFAKQKNPNYCQMKKFANKLFLTTLFLTTLFSAHFLHAASETEMANVMILWGGIQKFNYEENPDAIVDTLLLGIMQKAAPIITAKRTLYNLVARRKKFLAESKKDGTIEKTILEEMNRWSAIVEAKKRGEITGLWATSMNLKQNIMWKVIELGISLDSNIRASSNYMMTIPTLSEDCIELYHNTSENLFLLLPTEFKEYKNKNFFNFENLTQTSFEELEKNLEEGIINPWVKSRFELPNLNDLQNTFTKNNNIPSWNIYLMGHGSEGSIAHFSLDQFRKLLIFFNRDIQTNLLYYLTCYGGGSHLEEPFVENLRITDPLFKKMTPQYIIVSGATTDSSALRNTILKTTIFADYHDQALKTEIIEDFAPYINQGIVNFNPSNFIGFFNGLKNFFKNETDQKNQINSILSNLYEKEYSSIPSIRFPHSPFYRATEVDKDVEILTYVKEAAHELENNPIVLENKKCFLVYPPIVRVPVKIKGPEPTLILSMQTGPSLTYFEEIDTKNSINLKDFFLSEKFDFSVPKYFAIKKSSVSNNNILLKITGKTVYAIVSSNSDPKVNRVVYINSEGTREHPLSEEQAQLERNKMFKEFKDLQKDYTKAYREITYGEILKKEVYYDDFHTLETNRIHRIRKNKIWHRRERRSPNKKKN